MKTRRRTVLEDRDTMNRLRNTRSKKISVNEIEYSDPIPIDLIVEILSRLPAKSIAICRCVSKLWASIILRPYFTELFLSRSSSRPQVLFACHENGEFVFMSSPQPQNPDEKSSPVVSNHLKHFSIDGSCEISGPVHGLVCLSDLRISNGRKETKLMICNPSTGQSIPLPKVRTRRVGVNSYLGYDPIDKRFKVLSMTSLNYVGRSVFDEHQILTLGTGNKPSWKMIECCTPHYSADKGICINGVLYYLAGVDKYSSPSMIVCFDVRSEKFRFVKIVEALFRKVGRGALINYNGKLGVFVTQNHGSVDGRNGMNGGNIDLWVLEDAEKQEWSKNTYVLPALWQNTVGTTFLRFVGMTRTNEIVFSSVDRIPFSIFYYNLERNTIIHVGFQGLEVFKNKFVYKFLDHVEDVKFMQVF